MRIDNDLDAEETERLRDLEERDELVKRMQEKDKEKTKKVLKRLHFLALLSLFLTLIYS
jgi:hypothetical protein